MLSFMRLPEACDALGTAAAPVRTDRTLRFRCTPDHAASRKGVLDVINHAGTEAFKIAVSAIPMLVLSLVVVTALKQFGAIDVLTLWLSPLLAVFNIDLQPFCLC